MPDSERGLSAVRSPLSTYDILGYLAPGAALLLCVFGFEYWARVVVLSPGSLHTPILTLLQAGFSWLGGDGSWVKGTLLLVALAGLAYIVGHIVASVSAVTIDRAYVAKGHGYPFRSLLSPEDRPGNELSPNFYRAFFFWFNLYMLLLYLSVPNAVPSGDWLPRPLTALFPEALSHSRLALAARILGWLLLLMIMGKALASTRHGRRAGLLKRLADSSPGRKYYAAIDFLMRSLAYPARGVTGLLGNFLHTKHRMDEQTLEAFKLGYRTSIGFAPDVSTSSPYWYSVLHVRSSSASIAEPAENWLRLYSFARNLGIAFYLAFLYCYLWWFNSPPQMQFQSDAGRVTLYVLPLILYVSAFLMLLRYYYLYVDYYSKYLMRAVVYLSCPGGRAKRAES